MRLIDPRESVIVLKKDCVKPSYYNLGTLLCHAQPQPEVYQGETTGLMPNGETMTLLATTSGTVMIFEGTQAINLGTVWSDRLHRRKVAAALYDAVRCAGDVQISWKGRVAEVMFLSCPDEETIQVALRALLPLVV